MEYIKIGYINKPHGIKGELKVVVEDKFVDSFFDTDVVFVDMAGGKAPYFIESIRDAGFLLMTLEDFNTKEDVALLSKKSLYMRRSDINLTDEEIQEEDELQYGFLEGYTMYDLTTQGEVGKINAILPFPQQEMAEIIVDTKQKFIPIQPVWIVEIDKENQVIKMELPEGILDL